MQRICSLQTPSLVMLYRPDYQDVTERIHCDFHCAVKTWSVTLDSPLQSGRNSVSIQDAP